MENFKSGKFYDPSKEKNLPLRQGDFTNLIETLDYAAEGITGNNFYDGTVKLSTALPYAKLRNEARSLAISVPGTNRKDMAVRLIQCRKPQEAKRFDRVKEIPV